MGAGEAKLKEHFLFVIMANREGRVNEFLAVRLPLINIYIVISAICEYNLAQWDNKSHVSGRLSGSHKRSVTSS
jgi:hypothetical protein